MFLSILLLLEQIHIFIIMPSSRILYWVEIVIGQGASNTVVDKAGGLEVKKVETH